MDFWSYHGWLFLLGCALFPRITTLFFATLTFGPLVLLGWVFTPHLLVAILATNYYWNTNPVLVVIAWMFAFGGTATETEVAKSASN